MSGPVMLVGAGGTALASETRGPDGPTGHPVVATTGWANDRRVWSPMVDDLASNHAVTTWDLRGHGDSEAPAPEEYTRTHALGDLAAVLDHAGRPAVLMGHSLGGFLSLAHAVDYPDEVAGLVLVATGPGFRKAEAREQWNASVRASMEKLDLPVGADGLSMHHDAHVIDHLTDIEVPVLVLLGEHDVRFAASASLFERDLNVRETVVVPDTGHMVHVKAPTECAAAVRRFLAGL
ncbi:MAG: alpha/beta hydrolase [Actinomycetota bacterium]|nr:alpha/beta hydrolase [Acidimicrobiales bacterium]MEC9426592.1 alpha/beta hydrolase [Actinomycetota bacterium]MEC9448931.1 alpha/beta hydrolase [Actinomycetota bacterium]